MINIKVMIQWVKVPFFKKKAFWKGVGYIKLLFGALNVTYTPFKTVLGSLNFLFRRNFGLKINKRVYLI